MQDRLIAHRGWRSRFPENTLAAVEGAIQAGARAVEIDVQLSADGVPVLFHDSSLWRVCRRRGRISQHTLAQLQQYRASEPARFGERFRDEPIATLAEVAALLRHHPEVHLFLEIKSEALDRADSDRAVALILEQAAPLESRCTLISFLLKTLASARAAGWPRLGPVLRRWGQLSGRGVSALDPSVVFCGHDLLPAGPLDQPWPLAVYEIADPAQARRLLARGVHWIETFEIGEMIEALR